MATKEITVSAKVGKQYSGEYIEKAIKDYREYPTNTNTVIRGILFMVKKGIIHLI